MFCKETFIEHFWKESAVLAVPVIVPFFSGVGKLSGQGFAVSQLYDKLCFFSLIINTERE